MITADIDMTGFNQGIAALLRSVGATSRQIVEKETGELIKTLANITPPSGAAEKKKVETNIEKQIRKTFHVFGKHNNYEYDSAPVSKDGMKWYAASSKYLFGASPQNDMTKASQKELLTVHYLSKNIQGSKRIVADFKNRKTTQRIAIITRILTTEKQVKTLIKKVQASVGRMKAGWLVAVRDSKIKIGGRNLPPKWVTRHANSKCRGRWQDGLGTPDFPTFTIANFAKGMRESNYRFFVGRALEIRSAAMIENAKLFTSGRKNLNDYLRMGKVFSI